ncbi:hypothetical protein GQF03_07400 [Sneathiella chungangensis]|uniref:PsbP C-terminal domain-containing protein n=1 Tax=Sneathiella chungangensis TaxID=1418234 RepID=A0A845MEU4_9PROT|nr:hypothetical protein [Sneathiella chungangensis]MZR22152.1 hypothetical protein [Sneathiella chungangensis]
MRLLIILLLTLTIASCAPTFQLKKAGQGTMWDSYSVATSEDINELKAERSVMWTQDGPILERVEFWAPVANDNKLPLIYAPGNDERAGKFRSDMTPEEIVELVRNGFSLTVSTPTFIGNLQPVPFGDLQGYMIDVNLSTKDGADFKGKLLFATMEGKLMVIFFAARETHYYEARLPYFNNIVHSIKLS